MAGARIRFQEKDTTDRKRTHGVQQRHEIVSGPPRPGVGEREDLGVTPSTRHKTLRE